MRGRPRKFDEQKALTDAMLVFWEKGLSATSLDDLVQATSMNRPSLYNAFGNKEDIYRKSLHLFCGQLYEALEIIAKDTQGVRASFTAFFEQAIEVYCSNSPAMGCLAVCTAPSEALSHPNVGDDLKKLIKQLDEGFAKRLERAQAEGEVSPDSSPKLAAKLLQALLQTLALRARAGASKKELKDLVLYTVNTVII